jgi:hypothetical protein
MPRYRQRVPLESGPKLDLARLIPRGSGKPGTHIHAVLTCSSGEVIRAEVKLWDGWGDLILTYGEREQRFSLIGLERPFGGRQWYVTCPSTWKRVRVLYRPPGATVFASRHAWPRQVAYSSQFLDATGRAWRTKEKVKAQLLGDCDPDEWDLPPRPKGMRQKTYERWEAKYDEAEERLEEECAKALVRFMGWP